MKRCNRKNYIKYIRCKNLRIARVVDKISGIVTTEDSITNLRNTYQNWLEFISKNPLLLYYMGDINGSRLSTLIGSLFDTGNFKYS